jgi:hypothetical protein
MPTEELIASTEKFLNSARGQAVLTSATVAPRKGQYIQLHSGIMFWPADPREEEIDIEDIAHALSNQCRYAGHSPCFYSVAEHSVLCARQAPPELQLTALMHDAAEAYMPDMVRPLKEMMPLYGEMEKGVEAVIARKFGLVFPFPPKVSEIDNAMLCTEGRQFFTGQTNAWWLEPKLGERWYPHVVVEGWSPTRAKREFLAAFSRLAA